MSDEMVDLSSVFFPASVTVTTRAAFWLHPTESYFYGPTPPGTYLAREGELLTLYQVRANGQDGYVAFDAAKVRAYQRPRTRACCRRVARGTATQEDFAWLQRVGAGAYWIGAS